MLYWSLNTTIVEMFVHLDETRESKMSEIDMILAQRKKKIKRRKKSGDSILYK